LVEKNYFDVDEDQIKFALQSKNARGDITKAVQLVILFQEAADFVIKPYNPNIHMLGAVNVGDVTCYLDALLFGMYGILESFEVILCRHFEDEARRRLSTLLRLWINMLRSGWLIETDIVCCILSVPLRVLISVPDVPLARFYSSMWVARRREWRAARYFPFL